MVNNPIYEGDTPVYHNEHIPVTSFSVNLQATKCVSETEEESTFTCQIDNENGDEEHYVGLHPQPAASTDQLQGEKKSDYYDK